MKAAVFEGPPGSWPEKPMIIKEVDVPEIGLNDVLIRIAACGLCRTDLEYLKEGLHPPKAPPLILGHEPSGIIEEVGNEVENIKVGDRVIIPFTITCGYCFFCRTGQEHLCSNAEVIGASRDGAFAEFLSVPAKNAFLLPADLPLVESAVITDAVASPVHAVINIAEVKPGDNVVVYGASGGLGLVIVQIAYALGANVVAVGRKQWKLEKAKQFGASHTISTLEEDRADKTVRRLTGGGADIAFDATGMPEMINLAVNSIRPGGKVIVVGLSPFKVEININKLLWFEQKILGSRTYRPLDFFRAVEMVRKKMININELVSHRFQLEEINEGYRMLDSGEIMRGIVLL